MRKRKRNWLRWSTAILKAITNSLQERRSPLPPTVPPPAPTPTPTTIVKVTVPGDSLATALCFTRSAGNHESRLTIRE